MRLLEIDFDEITATRVSGHQRVGDVPERVVIAQGTRGLRERFSAPELAVAKCFEVVDRILRYEFIEPIEASGVHQVAVESQQFIDLEPVRSGERHRPTE